VAQIVAAQLPRSAISDGVSGSYNHPEEVAGANGHRPGENGRPALEKLAICESVCPFFIPGAAYGYTVLSISTNAHQVDKSLRRAQKISSLGCPTPSGIHRSGPNSALKYPNAHQVGKNDRPGARKFRLRKIYIPELTALVRSGLALAECGRTLPDGSRHAAAPRGHD
jgi:hypothetical protein